MSRILAPLNHALLPGIQEVEVSSTLQLPSIHIVGLPSPEVSEARERIRAAFDASGFEFPRRRVVLNLSPASIRKRGTGMDLAMALGVRASESSSKVPDAVAWGELSLDGRLRSPGQELRAVYAAAQAGIPRVILPGDGLRNGGGERIARLREARAFEGKFPVIQAVEDLGQAWEAFQDPESHLAPVASPSPGGRQPGAGASAPELPLLGLDPWLERVIGVAATGGHHLLLLGSRGSGKTSALEWLYRLAPDPGPEIRALRLLMSELVASPGSGVRRIGAQVKASALVGQAGSAGIRPGEFALAHGGILSADEFPEWSRDAREALREPLESGKVTLTRVHGSLEFPARFQLAATGNLCPCGGWDGSPVSLKQDCRCGTTSREQYLRRLSGPVMDRIDLVVRVPAPHRREEAPSGGRRGHSPAQGPSHAGSPLSERVSAARRRLLESLGRLPSQLSGPELEAELAEHSEWARILGKLAPRSHRDRHKTLRVALTLAAWEGLPEPMERHFFEASTYRDSFC